MHTRHGSGGLFSGGPRGLANGRPDLRAPRRCHAQTQPGSLSTRDAWRAYALSMTTSAAPYYSSVADGLT